MNIYCNLLQVRRKSEEQRTATAAADCEGRRRTHLVRCLHTTANKNTTTDARTRGLVDNNEPGTGCARQSTRPHYPAPTHCGHYSAPPERGVPRAARTSTTQLELRGSEHHIHRRTGPPQHQARTSAGHASARTRSQVLLLQEAIVEAPSGYHVRGERGHFSLGIVYAGIFPGRRTTLPQHRICSVKPPERVEGGKFFSNTGVGCPEHALRR